MYLKPSSQLKLACVYTNKYDNTFIQGEICFRFLWSDDIKTIQLFTHCLRIDLKCNGSVDSSFGLDDKHVAPVFPEHFWLAQLCFLHAWRFQWIHSMQNVKYQKPLLLLMVWETRSCPGKSILLCVNLFDKSAENKIKGFTSLSTQYQNTAPESNWSFSVKIK